MRIKFHLLPIILVVTAVEVSPSTASSAASKSSSSTSVSSSSGIFLFSLFPDWFRSILCKLYYLSYFVYSFLSRRLRLFSLLDFSFLVLLVSSFFYFYLRILSRIFTFGFLILSCVRNYRLVDFMNCRDLFFLSISCKLSWFIFCFYWTSY